MTTSVFDDHLHKVVFKRKIDNAETEQELVSICESFLKEKKPELFEKKSKSGEMKEFFDTYTPILSKTVVNPNNTKTYYATQDIDKDIFDRRKQHLMHNVGRDLTWKLMDEILNDNGIEFAVEEQFMTYSYRIVAKLTVVRK